MKQNQQYKTGHRPTTKTDPGHTITVTMPVEVAESLITALQRGLSVTSGPTCWNDPAWRERITTGLSALMNPEAK